MHYFIDGYNLLFRILDKGQEVQKARDEMIDMLIYKINRAEIHATLVFDSKYQPGPPTRNCKGNLDILFTDEGETADDWILNEVKRSPAKTEEKVVTTDKRLAVQIRLKGVQTISCEDFMEYLNKKVKLQIQNAKRVLKKEPIIPPPPVKKVAKGSQEYYEGIFEKKFADESLLRPAKPEKVKKPLKIKKGSVPKSPERSRESDMDRWSRLFQEREE